MNQQAKRPCEVERKIFIFTGNKGKKKKEKVGTVCSLARSHRQSSTDICSRLKEKKKSWKQIYFNNVADAIFQLI